MSAALAVVVLVGRPGPTVPTVVGHVDGDTLRVRTRSGTETVRLLGVDTPETVHPDRPVECWGPEASALLRRLVPSGTRVDLRRDTEPRDPYGRLLARVVRRPDGLDISIALLEAGAARVLIIAPNTTGTAALLAAEARARQARRGLWGHCGNPTG